jgi:purine nucleosidase
MSNLRDIARPIIIDSDPGQDDAVAILLALASPEELEVLAITAVAGNVPLDLTVTNALSLIELAGRSDVPVYRGARSGRWSIPWSQRSTCTGRPDLMEPIFRRPRSMLSRDTLST